MCLQWGPSASWFVSTGLPKYAGTLVERCVSLTRETLIHLNAYMKGTISARPDRQIIECSLDLLSALVETIKHQIEPLLSATDFLYLLEQCCTVSVDGV